jgi:cytochrome c peroxidase
MDQSLTNGIPLNNTEKQQLIAFLKTLTDREFINDPRFKEAN